MTTAVATAPRPACENQLALVDAAFNRPGSIAAHQLRDRYCHHCPIGQACLVAGMAGEDGFWGGTAPVHRAARRRQIRQATERKKAA